MCFPSPRLRHLVTRDPACAVWMRICALALPKHLRNMHFPAMLAAP
jgi:hypothetical protein